MALPRVQSLIINKLKELGNLAEEDVSELFATPRDLSGPELERMLMDEYRVSEFQILHAKSKAFDLNPFVGRRYRISDRTFEKLDEDFCLERQVIPIGVIGEVMIVALSNPFDLQVAQEIQKKTNLSVQVLLGQEYEIEEILKSGRKGLSRADGVGFSDVVEELQKEYDLSAQDFSADELEDEESAPIIQLANRIIEEAYYSGASDIHVEPQEKECRVRVRVDGVCHDRITLPSEIAVFLVTRLKVMANMDIAEKRLPQDGRIAFQQFTKKPLDIDLRVSTAPLLSGEGIIMRILDKQKSVVDLKELGYEKENLKKYQEVVKRPYGMILHCGPTGSGKTTTLYSALNYINNSEVVIRTAEDPIEYTQPGLCQMQMMPKIGLTFASALRSFLRQDPDVILVGEIRDRETGSIAIEAALTGHLLFSTLHTNDAPTSITRLLEMGIEPFMVSASLLCVCAQRLVRRLCKSCRQSYEAEGREREVLEQAIKWNGTIYKANGAGCPNCRRSGYRGRMGIHELLIASERIIEGINNEVDALDLKKMAIMDGMSTLHQDSMMKVKSGMTSMAEAVACVPPDMEDIDTIKEEFELQNQLRMKREAERRKEIEALKAERAEV